MIFFENIGATGIVCPHEDAFLANGKVIYYRRVNAIPPTSDCFLPNDRIAAPDACLQKSISIFDNMEGLINAVFKTPASKKKPRMIAALTLTPTCGMLKQTGSRGHHSWWRSLAFNPATAVAQTI